MIITIDGPAGAGKSSASKILATRLGFEFLDTGAMYRAITWAALRDGISVDDEAAVAELAAQTQIAFVENEVVVDGVVVTDAIREHNVTSKVSPVADNPGVREIMVHLQREYAKYGNYVCEGRDQGTVVFPNAQCKFFLTASAEQRAERRRRQLRQKGSPANFDQLLAEQNERDRRDYSRSVGRLERAADAIEIDTDNRSLESVVDEMESIARERIRKYLDPNAVN